MKRLALRARPWVAPLVGISHYVHVTDGSPAIASGRVSARSMTSGSPEESSWLEGMWFDRSHRKFELCGCAVSTNCRWWMFVCAGSVAVPGTFLMEAMMSEGFNPEIDGEDVLQVCILELPGVLFDSITTLPLEIGDLGLRTTDEAPPGLVEALLARSLSGGAEQEDGRVETPRGTLPIAGTSPSGWENPARGHPS